MTKRKVSDIAPAAEPKAKPAPDRPAEPWKGALPLTDIQELLADLLGDVILRGTRNEDVVDGIIFNAVAHQWDLRFEGTPLDDREKNMADDWVRKEWREWKRKLIQSWPLSGDRPQPKPRPEPSTLTDYLREDVRGRLEERFRDFLSAAVPEEIRFMESVLMDWENASLHSVNVPQLEIANSFEREIGRSLRYVRVPREYRDRVVSFVELLTKPTKAA